MNYTFYQVISASSQAPLVLRSLQNRCLVPGYYSTHLQRWLTYYPSGQVRPPKSRAFVRVPSLQPSLRNLEGTTPLSLQLLIVDGQELRINPAASMEIIQKFLGITPFLNYTRTLRWESMV